jgi:phenylacetate-coenzyme A ligase PaaK-like adenylate-forming protein
VLEPVDASYRPVEPGTASHTVLLTNLANRLQPLIRYDLGDSITQIVEPCPCGSPLPAIHVQGRHDDVLVFARRSEPPIKILPLVVTTVLEEDAGVHDFQLVQTGPRHLKLLLGGCPPEAAQRARGALAAYLAAQDVRRATIELDSAAPCRSARSGKLRRVIYAVRSSSNPPAG